VNQAMVPYSWLASDGIGEEHPDLIRLVWLGHQIDDKGRGK
jgi:hypothetical protein